MVFSLESLAFEQGADVKPLAGVPALAIGVVFAAALIAVVTWLVLRRRPSPAARERRRRLAIQAKGRMADATILDFQGDELFYSYTVRGVEYTASQDVSALRDRLPENLTVLLGCATVKYQPANPANSIVVSEEWSGLRERRTPPAGRQEGERSLP
jgi:hypothetical protein